MTPLLTTLRRNVFSPFIGIVCVLAAALFFFGQTVDALFLLSTITINSAVAVIQELRARGALSKLELLNPRQVRRHTKNGYEVIGWEALRAGDTVLLSAGDQIPADGQLVSAEQLSCNESLITGESGEVYKKKGELVLAGSSVLSGSGSMVVQSLAANTRAGQMESHLKDYSPRQSSLQHDLTQLLRWMTVVAVLMGGAIYIDGRLSQTELPRIISAIAAGAITLVPEGLVLASTLLLSYGALRIARESVLVQRLNALETFGRLQVLCVDKTGTLTEPTPSIHAIMPFFPYPEHRVTEMLASFLAEPSTRTPSLEPLADRYGSALPSVHDHLPFSSGRKFSAVRASIGQDMRVVQLGAPDVLGKHSRLTAKQQAAIANYQEAGLRVLLVVDHGSAKGSLAHICQSQGQPAGLLVLEQPLRAHVADSIFYLQAQKVQVRVISGDALETVQSVARAAGIRHWNRALTGDQLSELDEVSWNEQIPRTVVFARVLPEQKERIIETLQLSYVTGMVGDGVNDSLALKRADLGVAMLQGSQASRQVADVVLLTNDFSVFPAAMRLGSQIILALQMIACVFFNRVSYNLTILLGGMLLGVQYPLEPRHLLMINWITIGLPTMLWALIPPSASYRLNTSQFFPRVLRFAVPNGIITGLSITLIWQLSRLQGSRDYTALSMLAIMTLGILAFWLIPRAMGATISLGVRRFQLLYTIGSVAVIGLIFSSELFRIILDTPVPQLGETLAAVLVIFVAAVAQNSIVREDRGHGTMRR